jgi:hypothetical protein
LGGEEAPVRTDQAALVTALAVALVAGSAVAVTAQSEASAEPTAGVFVGTELPNGTYSADITADDLIAKGASPDFAEGNQGTWAWTFQDGSFLIMHPSNHLEACAGTYESIDGTLVRMTTTVEAGCTYQGDVQWAQELDGIRLEAVPTHEASDEPADIAAYFDRVFLRVE